MIIPKQMYKPEYFFQPSRLFSRFNYYFNPPENKFQKMPLSWGSSIIANPRQTIGRSLYTFGLYDLALSELIFRLVRPGDLVLDVGANIGYTTRLFLDCLQNQGKLISFEPLPELFKVLNDNVDLGSDSNALLMNLALSDKIGEAILTLPQSYSENDGVATLEPHPEGKKINIKTTTIDALNLTSKVRVMKMDVEGHELSVLKGAINSLEADIFEHIIYEDLGGHTGEVSTFLESKGYRIYKLVKGFTGLSLKAPNFKHDYSYEPDNYLATKDSNIASIINSKQEWKLFKNLKVRAQ